jgi:ribonuclease HI
MAEGEEREVDEIDPEIHCFGDTPPFPHLTQSSYEDSLMDSQLNELSRGDKASGSRGRYNLRSDKKTAAPDIPEYSIRAERHDNEVATGHRGKKSPPSPIVHNHVPEIKEIPKPTSSFNFEHEIQKIRIPVPLTEMIKHDEFKKCFSELLQSEASCLPSDSINLQDEKPAIVLGPMVEDRDDSSPPFYTSLNIHDKVLHNCLMDSGASHNLMPKTIMEELGLEVTRAYHDLYSFDSRRV